MANTPYACTRRRDPWDSDHAMNILCNFKKLGFKVSWNLIAIGVYGYDEIPPSITYLDVVDYLEGMLTYIDEQTDNIIALICVKDDYIEFDKLLKKLASKDNSNIAVQKRKWRAYLLENLMNNINEDSLQGQLQLMEFWMKMDKPNNCPQNFPNRSRKSIEKYFNQGSYELNLNNNREWLKKEIQSIIELEKG